MRFKKITAGALTALLLLTGCTPASPAAAQAPAEKEYTGYTAGQIHILLSSERSNISSAYTDQIFDAVVDYEGKTYEDYYEEMMKDYVLKVQGMVDMADDKGIELSEQEERTVRQTVSRYMSDLKEDYPDAELSESDVRKVFHDQYLIPKLREEIMRDMTTEVSESDARIMEIAMIVMNTRENANAAMSKLSEGSDFMTVAKASTVEGTIEMKVDRESLSPEITKVIFDLEDGEVSPIIQADGRFYIVKCISGYDAEATAVNKERLIKERRADSVGVAYTEFAAENPPELSEEEWEKGVALYRENAAIPNVYDYLR